MKGKDMEFKVGDKVRILGGTEQRDWNMRMMEKTIGMVGEITKIDTRSPKYRVTFENKKWWDYNEEDLEKVEDLRELIKPSYAVRIRDGRWLIAFVEQRGRIGMNDIDNISYGVTAVSNFKKNTLNHDFDSRYDIMEIRGYAENNPKIISIRDVVWEREEKSQTQIKLEELENEQRQIADKIAELMKEL